MGEKNAKMHRGFLVQQPEGNRPLWRSRHRWQGNIKMDLKQNGRVWTGLMLLGSTQNWQAVVNTIRNFWVS